MSREQVLAQIRHALGERKDLSPQRSAQVQWPRPAVGGTLRERFCARLEHHACQLLTLAAIEEVPARVLAFLAEHHLPERIAIAAPLAALDWPQSLRRDTGAAGSEVRCAVSLAFCGIAENGSLMMCSGPDSPTTHNFVPEHHIVVVRADTLVAHPEDAWARLRRHGATPRAINLIAGPSRTGDVEQTIQLGAHGPRSVLVMLVG